MQWARVACAVVMVSTGCGGSTRDGAHADASASGLVDAGSSSAGNGGSGDSGASAGGKSAGSGGAGGKSATSGATGTGGRGDAGTEGSPEVGTGGAGDAALVDVDAGVCTSVSSNGRCLLRAQEYVTGCQCEWVWGGCFMGINHFCLEGLSCPVTLAGLQREVSASPRILPDAQEDECAGGFTRVSFDGGTLVFGANGGIVYAVLDRILATPSCTLAPDVTASLSVRDPDPAFNDVVAAGVQGCTRGVITPPPSAAGSSLP